MPAVFAQNSIAATAAVANRPTIRPLRKATAHFDISDPGFLMVNLTKPDDHIPPPTLGNSNVILHRSIRPHPARLPNHAHTMPISGQ